MVVVGHGKKSIDVGGYGKKILAWHEYDSFKYISIKSIDVVGNEEKSIDVVRNMKEVVLAGHDYYYYIDVVGQRKKAVDVENPVITPVSNVSFSGKFVCSLIYFDK